MHINIVTESAPGWILRRLAESFAANLSGTTVSVKADPRATVNFYVNYALYSEPTRCDVGYFTHRDVDSPYTSVFDAYKLRMDYCIAMCARTAALLPAEKTSVLKPAPDPLFHRGPLRFGVVAREYPRKRLAWIPRLESETGVQILLTGGELGWEELPRFYENIDYLLVLSDNEGGPMPVLEALACRKPVICSDVGFVEDYTTIRYRDFGDLVRIIRGLQIPEDGWAQASAELYAVLRGVVERSGRP